MNNIAEAVNEKVVVKKGSVFRFADSTQVNLHPTYCPFIDGNCTSGGATDCLNRLDDRDKETRHPKYTSCPDYDKLSSEIKDLEERSLRA